jgi:molybdopterin-containing oxidoreductase family iron-sulfur binding subunit
MTRWAMVIDLDLCTSCGSCVVSCAQENNNPPGDPESAPERLIRWMEVIPAEQGKYPDTRLTEMPSPCQHCDHPPCTKVCPVYATYQTSEGLVPQVYHQCIGCRYCVNACPYTCKHFNWFDPEWPAPLDRGLNPDVSVRTRGVTEKCNFCMHRLQIARDDAAGEERELAPSDYRTACQQACPTKAIQFGDKDDESSAVAGAEDGRRALILLHDLGTHPKVTYLKEPA